MLRKIVEQSAIVFEIVEVFVPCEIDMNLLPVNISRASVHAGHGAQAVFTHSRTVNDLLIITGTYHPVIVRLQSCAIHSCWHARIAYNEPHE